MRVLTRLIGLILIVVGGWVAWNVIPASGVIAGLKPKLIEECRAVTIAPGTEDVTIDAETGIAFVSADDRRATAAGAPVQGGVYALRLDGTDRVSKASSESFGDFHPHGISLWRGSDGRKRLFVVNHTTNQGDKVEIFDVGYGGALLHVDSIQFDEMTSANDVLGVGPRSFYVTNDKGVKDGFLSKLEGWLALPLSSLAYFDGQDGSIAARGLAYANGVNMSADGKTVYVSEILGRRVTLYDRDAASGALTRRSAIRVNTAPDNIEIGADGALWIGGHPKIFDFLKFAEGKAPTSPSHVIRVNPETGVVEDILVDLDGTINASSAAAVLDNILVVGSVFDDHVMVCPQT